jgi:heme oxygenase
MAISTAMRFGKDERVLGNEARARLRQLTSGAHEALHRQWDFAAILSGDLTMGGYAALLSRLYLFHDLFEQQLGKAPTHLAPEIDFDARRKAELLGVDIASLGMVVSKFDRSPMRRLMAAMDSAESLVGSLYVVEGAGLGGRLIAQKLNYLFGQEGRVGRQFFWGRSDPDSLPWPLFCDILEWHAATGDFEKIKAAALHTFDAFAFALNDCLGDG